MRVVGVGARPGTPADEIEAALVAAGIGAADLVATVDTRVGDTGIAEVARRHGWPLVSYSASLLAVVDVPGPSTVVSSATGTPSVAEAAALLAAGAGATLVVPKTSTARVTVALAEVTP
jgi:cobalt-precorrin 5A hydrolase